MQHGLLLIVELSVSENHLDRINSQNISVTEKYVKKCSETSTQETLEKCFVTFGIFENGNISAKSSKHMD